MVDGTRDFFKIPHVVDDSLHVFAKNARINSDIRKLCMLGELPFMEWDIICFSETRYLTEDSILHGNHRLIANLSTKSASGVAILIHQKHVSNVLRQYRVNDRVLGIDIRFGGKFMRIVAVYLPMQDMLGQNLSKSWMI